MARLRHAALPALALCGAALLAGCGSGGHLGGHLNSKGRSTPANALNMSVALGARAVAISPARVGGGQLILNVANTSGYTQGMSVERVSGAALKRVTRTPWIPAGGSAQMKLTVLEGRYLLVARRRLGDGLVFTAGATSRQLRAAALRVGPARSGDDSLDAP